MAYALYNASTDTFDVVCGQGGCNVIVGSGYSLEADADEDAEIHTDDHVQAYLDGE